MIAFTVKNTFVDVQDACDEFDIVPSTFTRGISEPPMNQPRVSPGVYAPPSKRAALINVVAESQDSLPMMSTEAASEATSDQFDQNFDSQVEEEEEEEKELSDLAHVQLSSDYGRNGVPLGLTEMEFPPLGAALEKKPPSCEEAFSRLATPGDPFTRLQTPGGEFTRLVTQDPLSDMDVRSCTRMPTVDAEVKAMPTRGGLSPQGGPKSFGTSTEVKPLAQSRSIAEETAATPVHALMGQNLVAAPMHPFMGQNLVMQPPMMYQPQLMMMMPWPGPMFPMQQQQQQEQSADQQQQQQEQEQEDYDSSDKSKRQRKKKAKASEFLRGRPSLIDMAMKQKEHIENMFEEQNRNDPVVGRCRSCSGELRTSYKFCRYCGNAANQ